MTIIICLDIVEYGTMSEGGWRLDLLALVVVYSTITIVEYRTTPPVIFRIV